MDRYQMYLSVSVEHNYFETGSIPTLEIVPTQKTLHWLQQHQMLMAKTKTGICIVANQNTLKDISAPKYNFHLQFKLYTKDSYFQYYTETTIPTNRSIAIFEALFDQRNGTQIEISDWFSKEQLIEKFGETAPDVFETLDYGRNYIGFASFLCSAENFLTSNREVHLTYKQSQAYWKYYILFQKPHIKTNIIDLNNNYSFEYLGEEQINNYKNVPVYMSDKPIPLHQHSKHHFQLKDLQKTIYRSLPIADPKQMEFTQIKENLQKVCNIYVS